MLHKIKIVAEYLTFKKSIHEFIDSILLVELYAFWKVEVIAGSVDLVDVAHAACSVVGVAARLNRGSISVAAAGRTTTRAAWARARAAPSRRPRRSSCTTATCAASPAPARRYRSVPSR